MQSILICPAARPEVRLLAEATPLALAPCLGKSLVEYWLEHLAAHHITRVRLLASDRPGEIRAAVGDGARWGLRIEVTPETHELTPEEARAKYRPLRRTESSPDWPKPPDDIQVLESLPGRPELRPLASYAGWVSALQAWLPHAPTPDRIGLRELQPGVLAGWHTRVSPRAQLRPPCWLGENVMVGPDAVVGPGAIVENCVLIDAGARIVHSVVGPETFVGKLTLLENSIALGNTLINWTSGSRLRVPDPCLLCSLREWRSQRSPAGSLGRALALGALVATAPAALLAIVGARLRAIPAWNFRQALRPVKNVRSAFDGTVAYAELAGARGWLRRWPQLWSIVRGDFAWIGNRPLAPDEARALASDFERLWLTAPLGLISLADVDGCGEGVTDATCARSSYYAAQASRRLNWSIAARALGRIISGDRAPSTAPGKELFGALRRPLLRTRQ